MNCYLNLTLDTMLAFKVWLVHLRTNLKQEGSILSSFNIFLKNVTQSHTILNKQMYPLKLTQKQIKNFS